MTATCANRIRPGTCGRCQWFKPPFHDLHWKGRVMRDTMSRPELRELARAHAARINRDPDVRQRQWAGRRAKRAAAMDT